jgi:hypothetical protein
MTEPLGPDAFEPSRPARPIPNRSEDMPADRSSTLAVEDETRHQPTEHSRSSSTDPLRSEPAGTGADQDDVVQLREALRAAERAYRGYLVGAAPG